MNRTNPSRWLAIALFSLLATPVLAGEADFTQLYTKTERMVPMRDGVELYCEIYTPKDQEGELPILLMRTPYGTKGADGGFTRYFATNFRQLAQDRYIIVVQDARGRHLSEGKFEWNRPLRHRDDPQAIDASTDAYDTIDWLVKHVPNNNGRVGMLGVSYPGWYVTMALIDPHPALKAASPQASPSDYFVGDDFFHNGAFRLSPSAELPYLFDFDPKTNARFPYDQVDTYEFFLDLGPLSNMNARYLKNVSPTWDNFMRHATYDEYWQAGNTLQHLTSHDVPTLQVVGWWDAENLNGQLDIYTTIEPLDDDNQNFLVVGPWSHGQWSRGPADHLAAYKFGSDTMTYYQELESRFFAHHLKGAADPQLAEATLFQTGSNEWKTYDSWPPKQGVTTRSLYLAPNGKLSWEKPRGDDGEPFASYISDPDNPVPYSKRPIMGFWQGMSESKDPRFGRAGINWKVEDQRFVDGRPDVLTFVTEPLAEPVELTGTVVAKLFGSTSGTDCDWVVKLIDVYPEKYEPEPEMGGYQLMIADDVVRAKFRHSLSKPQPVEPGKVEEYTIDLRTRNHLFRPGHRIMVQVQSTWFPLVDRNPQTFVDIPAAKESDFQKAEQRVYFSPEYPSRVELMVAGAATVVRGHVRGSDDAPRLVWRLELSPDAQGKPILPTKQELYEASQSAPMEQVAADGTFELAVRPGYQALFAFADLNGNGRWDPDRPEPMGWHSTEAAGDVAPIKVSHADVEGIEIELKVPTPFPRDEQVTEGGSLRWIKGYPVLHLKGDAHTRGYAHGKLAAAQIVDFFRFYVLEEKLKSAKAYEEGFAKFLETNFAWPAEMVAECEAVIEGMKASGSDLHIPELGRDFSLVDLYAINGYIETRAMASHCTQFAAWGDRTTGTDVGGGMITGRNMDGEIDIRRVTVSHFLLMAVEPTEPGHKRYVSMMWPGFMATISGINEEGFYTMENAGLTGPGPVVDRLVPFSWTMRQALVTQGADATPSGVQMLIDSFDNSAGGSCGPGCITLFATPYNGQRDPAWVHEGDRFGDANRTAGEAPPHIPQTLVASNHPRKYGVDRLRPGWVFDVKPSYSSLWRYEAGRHKLEGWHRTGRKIGTPQMQELLQTVAHGTTEYSVVTRPNAREFDVAVASLQAELWDAPYREWTTFKFDEVFGPPATSTAAR